MQLVCRIILKRIYTLLILIIVNWPTLIVLWKCLLPLRIKARLICPLITIILSRRIFYLLISNIRIIAITLPCINNTLMNLISNSPSPIIIFIPSINIVSVRIIANPTISISPWVCASISSKISRYRDTSALNSSISLNTFTSTSCYIYLWIRNS